VWADLVEPVGGVRQGGGRERGGCRCRTRRAETSGSKRKCAGGVLAVSRWPAEGDWSKAAAVVVSTGWSVARSRAQQDKQTDRQRLRDRHRQALDRHAPSSESEAFRLRGGAG
jgi:hypothetical protein